LEKAFEAYEKILLFTAERPESQLSLAIFYHRQKKDDKAEQSYLEAIRLQSQFVPAYINYSSFLMQKGKNAQAAEILKKGLKAVPNMAILHHALGLWYVRNKEKEKSLEELKKSTQLDENNARFAYVYAIAIAETNVQDAIDILEKAYLKHRGDIQIVSGLVYYYKQTGKLKKSKAYEDKLKALQNFSVR
jgi:Tfp pilus assembly protein PilF